MRPSVERANVENWKIQLYVHVSHRFGQYFGPSNISKNREMNVDKGK